MSDTKEFHVGELSAKMPEPTQYEPSPFKKGRPPEPLQFEVNMTAEAHDRQKKSGSVQVNIPGFSPVKLYCDEQVPVGDDTAPPPLAFFCAGIGFCLMTHLTDIYTARKIKIKSMKIEQKVRFETNLSNMRELGHTTDGKTLGIETHVLIDSDEPQERIKDLMDEAENACMAHFALRNPIPWQSRLIHNGEELLNREG
ncbi:OsmC family protein [Pontivivens nitratireducens]|uniref:OsmC family protein n=1 Tax=Pontivivens nitratireducens TaxID=2758038 RepID=UPI00163A237F|nr:OsmC family protein [Pontibrevibacter nitratireducens]